MSYTIEYLESIPPHLEEMISHGHKNDEADQGIVCNYQKFSLVIKSRDSEPIGVLSAYTAFAEIYVDDLWIQPKHRKNGLGRKLLEYLEDRFKNEGYNNINLVTSEFQAPEFYKKCGFQIEFIRKNKVNPKLTKTFFIKYFDNQMQTQGMLKL